MYAQIHDLYQLKCKVPRYIFGGDKNGGKKLGGGRGFANKGFKGTEDLKMGEGKWVGQGRG